MAQDGHTEHPKYMNIFWWLLGLTVAEVLVVIPDLPIAIKAILLIGMACSKAALVAIYFMHLKFERKTLAAIVITPFLICVFLVVMLMPDLTLDTRLDGIEKPAAEVVDTSAH
ncbi:MAG: cytochrome C oxidase subunit IV family protein [Candidatus Poribacteria bacterium]|nr:cytochrome C oxidase subunit IV family protein [Candidatus Poribacteria bacterium]